MLRYKEYEGVLPQNIVQPRFLLILVAHRSPAVRPLLAPSSPTHRSVSAHYRRVARLSGHLRFTVPPPLLGPETESVQLPLLFLPRSHCIIKGVATAKSSVATIVTAVLSAVAPSRPPPASHTR